MKEASFHNVIVLKGILRCFELVFGLKINFHKSKLSGGVVIGAEERGLGKQGNVTLN